MKCEWVQDNILLYVYNELADDARYELEQHLGRCPECATELKSARAFHAADCSPTGFAISSLSSKAMPLLIEMNPDVVKTKSRGPWVSGILATACRKNG